MYPELLARHTIDRLLETAGWVVQDRDRINLGAGVGVAVREYRLASGPVAYLLFVNRKAVGVVEAKPGGTTLSGVAEGRNEWLELICDQVAVNLDVQPDDLWRSPFSERGGAVRAALIFGQERIGDLLAEINDALSA